MQNDEKAEPESSIPNTIEIKLAFIRRLNSIERN